MSSFNMVSYMNNYTNFFYNFNSCLDHIFFKNSNFYDIKLYIIKSDITDHFAIAFQFKNDDIDRFNKNNI